MFPLLCRFADFYFLRTALLCAALFARKCCVRHLCWPPSGFLRCRCFCRPAASWPQAGQAHSCVRDNASAHAPAFSWSVLLVVPVFLLCGRGTISCLASILCRFLSALRRPYGTLQQRVCLFPFFLSACFVPRPWRFSGICYFSCGYIIASELRLFFVYSFLLKCVFFAGGYWLLLLPVIYW